MKVKTSRFCFIGMVSGAKFYRSGNNNFQKLHFKDELKKFLLIDFGRLYFVGQPEHWAFRNCKEILWPGPAPE